MAEQLEHQSYAPIHLRWVQRYTSTERWLHWGHAITFFVLVGTGFPLFAGFLAPLTQGESGQFLRFWHRVAAVFFALVPVTYAILQPRRLRKWIRDLMFDRSDLKWVKGALPYYLFGRHESMPPQGRWNTGEKLNVVVSVGGLVVFTITGSAMWFGKGILSPEIFRTMVIIHDLTMVATVNMFIVHFFLSTSHPLMWGALESMRFGVAPEGYMRNHHGRWYEAHFGTGARGNVTTPPSWPALAANQQANELSHERSAPGDRAEPGDHELETGARLAKDMGE
ncbi:MAG TPA: cytochrome b/b6 domain-containing protein [Chloroflexota bacterium]|nr:cytochrome b/b6 domain-containing protein [Chloroflexota bacterium]